MPNGIDSYRLSIIKILDELTPDKLRELVSRTSSLAMDKLSRKIFLITRKSREKISDDVVVTPITDFVKSQLVIRFRNLQNEEQIQLYKHFSRSCFARSMTDLLFEAI